MVKKEKDSVDKSVKVVKDDVPATMKFATEREIAMDFATKVYTSFDTLIKSIVLFGSSAKKVPTSGSDIDLIIIIDDAAIKWDAELVSWYREELGKIVRLNPYRRPLHINTVKLSTWWNDLLKGDPTVLNVLRYGDSLIDAGGFFDPLKVLLAEGKIRSTPEAIYTLLERAPYHFSRAKASLAQALDGLYWAMVDSSHAALISAGVMPPSPEHIADILTDTFVKNNLLKKKFVQQYEDVRLLAKDIAHGKKIEVSAKSVDEMMDWTENFLGEMARLTEQLVKARKN